MIQWKRAPIPSSGSKWKISRCIQYSVSVQNTYPPSTRPITCSVVGAPRAPTTSRATMAGTKITTGTIGCTRESRSSRSDSNILGEAFRTSVRRASTRPNLAFPADPETSSSGSLTRRPERPPGGDHEVEPEGRRGGVDDRLGVERVPCENAPEEVAGDRGDEEQPACALHAFSVGSSGPRPVNRP